MSSYLAVPGADQATVMLASSNSPSPQPTAGAAAGAAAAATKRIMLPAELEMFVKDAWRASCRDAGFEVIAEPEPACREGGFILVISAKAAHSSFAKIVAMYSKKGAAPVRFVSEAVFNASAGLGAFPASLEAFRHVLDGCLLCPTSLSAATKKHAQIWCESLGGRFDGTFTREVTHLIAAKALGDKYKAAAKLEKPVVSHEWIEACFRSGSKVSADKEEYRVPCLLGGVIVAINLSPAQQAQAQKLVTSAGGQFHTLDEETRARLSVPPSPSTAHTPLRLFDLGGGVTVTHVVASYPVPAQVIDQAHVKNIPVATLAWLEAFVASRGGKAEPKDFPVTSPAEEQLKLQAAAERKAAEQKRQEQIKKAQQDAEAEANRQAKEAHAAAEAAEEAARLSADKLARSQAEARAREESARVAAAEEADAETRAIEAQRQLELSRAKEGEVEYDAAHDNYLSALLIVLFEPDSRQQLDQLVKIVRYGGGTRLMSIVGRENIHQPNVNCTSLVLVVGGSQRRDVLEEKLREECSNRTISFGTLSFPVVTHQWLLDCHAAKRVMPFPPYYVPAVDPLLQASTPAPAPRRSISPAQSSLQRTASRAPLMTVAASAVQRQLSARSNSPSGDMDRTLDVSNAAGAKAEGATDFSLFNAQLPTNNSGGTRSGKPPPIPERGPSAAAAAAAGVSTAVAPALLKMAATSSSNAAAISLARLFSGLTFVLEDDDEGDGTAEGAEEGKSEPPSASPLRELLYTRKHALTVRKQLTDYGALGSNILSPGFARAEKASLRYVIGGVCGSSSAPTPSAFKTRYGKAEYASYHWVAACIKAEKLLPLDSPVNVCWNGSIPRQLCPKATRNAAAVRSAAAMSNVPGFSALRLSGSGFSADENAVLAALAQHAGAEWTGGLKTTNTHLLYSEASKNALALDDGKPGTKLYLALKSKLPVVTAQWLLDCMSKKEMLNEADYAISPALLESAMQHQSATPATAAAAEKPSTSRRATRVPSIVSAAVPDTPMLPPDTPLLAAPTPLPPSHFAPGSPVLREGEIPDEPEAAVDAEEEEDDLGFSKALRGANALAQGMKKPMPSPAPNRARQRAEAKNSPAAAAAAVAPVAAASAASAPPAKLSAREEFLRKRASQSQTPSRGSLRKPAAATSAPIDEDEDEEAELNFAPLSRKPAAKAAEEEDVWALPDDVDDVNSVPAPLSKHISPFKSVRAGKDAAGASSAAAAADSKSTTTDAIVAPASSGKKVFRKAARGVPSTPPDAEVAAVSAAVPEFTSKSTAASAAASSATPAAAKRVRRRVILDDSQEDAPAAAEDEAPSAAVDDAPQPMDESLTPIEPKPAPKGKAKSKKIIVDDDADEAEPEVEAAEAEPTDDDEQPGSSVKPKSKASTAAAKRKEAAAAKSAAAAKKKAASKSAPKKQKGGKKKKRDSSDEESESESEEEAYSPSESEQEEAEPEAVEEEAEVAAESDEGEAEFMPVPPKKQSNAEEAAAPAKKGAAAKSKQSVAAVEDKPEPKLAAPSSSGTPDDDAEEWQVPAHEQAPAPAAVAASPAPATTTRRGRQITPAASASSTPVRTPRAPPRQRGAAAAAAAATATPVAAVAEEEDEEETKAPAKEPKAAKLPAAEPAVEAEQPATPARKPRKKTTAAEATPASKAEKKAEPAAAPAAPSVVADTPVPAAVPLPVVSSPAPSTTSARGATRRTPPSVKQSPPAAPSGLAKVVVSQRKAALKTGAPVRSGSLGGAPESSLANFEAAQRAQARASKSKRALPPTNTEPSQAPDDPFAFNGTESEEEAATAAAAKSAGKKKPAATAPVQPSIDTEALTESDAAAGAAAAPAPASKASTKSAASSKHAIELADDETTPPPTPAKPKAAAAAAESIEVVSASAAKPKGRGKLAKKQDPAEETPPVDAPPAVATAEPSKKGGKGKKAAEPVSAEDPPVVSPIVESKKSKSKKGDSAKDDAEPADAAAAVEPKKITKAASKRKRGDDADNAETVPAAAAAAAVPASSPASAVPAASAAADASPMKRSLSTKAALSLSTLKFSESVADEPAAETKPNKRAKKATNAAAKKSAEEDASVAESSEAEAAPVLPAQSSQAGKKRKAVASDSASSAAPAAASSQKADVVSPSPPTKPKSKAAAASAASSASSAARLITMTGFKEGKEDQISFLSQLSSVGTGGVLVEDADLDYTTLTHIVSANPRRSEKLLMGLVTHAFIMHPLWLEACAKAGKWLPESRYEWRHQCAESDALAGAFKQWHPTQTAQPYAGWRVTILPLDGSSSSTVYQRLLDFGGAAVLERTDRSQTHLLVECDKTMGIATPADFKAKGGKQYTAVQAILARHKDPESVLVADVKFVADFLVEAQQAKPILLVEHAATTAATAASSSSAAAASSTPGRGKGSQKASQKASQPADEDTAAEAESGARSKRARK